MKNQALRLSEIMQDMIKTHPNYELAFPLVKIGSSKLRKLAVDDILVLGDTLEFILIDNYTICAELIAREIKGHLYLEVNNIDKNMIRLNESKKYKTIKISFGMIQSKKVELGHQIDMKNKSIEDVTLLVEEERYASGSLINVNGEIAVKIDKVEK